MIDLAKKKEPIHGRLVQYLLKELLIDGGQWDMLVNLVNKYGVVPKAAFPESSSSEAALQMNKFLRTKVRFSLRRSFRLRFARRSIVTRLCSRNLRNGGEGFGQTQ